MSTSFGHRWKPTPAEKQAIRDALSATAGIRAEIGALSEDGTLTGQFVLCMKRYLPALLDVAEAAQATVDHMQFIPGDPDAFYMQAPGLEGRL